MADKKISELTALTTSDGAEELIVNDGGTSKKITISNANKKLFDGSNVKLETTSGGVTITGTATATAFAGDGSALTGITTLPSQTSNSGKFLTTNGSVASWAVVDALPTQTNNSGKFLTTNGTTASWTTIATGSVTTNGGWEHAHTIASNYTIASGNNLISAGAITINTGVSVTVPSGSTWVIA